MMTYDELWLLSYLFCNVDNLAFGGKGTSGNIWKSYSAYTSGYQSVDHLSDIDEFEENFKVCNLINGLNIMLLSNILLKIEADPIFMYDSFFTVSKRCG